MRSVLRWIAAHPHPRSGVALGVVISVIAAATAIMFDQHPVVFSGALLGSVLISVVGILMMPLLQAVMTNRTRTGFTWVNPAGVSCVLVASFLGPVAVIITGMFTAVTYWVIQKTHTKNRWSANLAALLLPYTLAAIFAQQVIHPQSLLSAILCVTAVIIISEVMNSVVLGGLLALIEGDISVPTTSLFRYPPTLIIAGLSLLVCGVYQQTNIGIAAIVCLLAFMTLLTAEQVLRSYHNFLGMRALSWGVTTTALNFMGKLDDRTYRHSLSTARYTRDALAKWGFPKAAQDLGYMAGLLHKAGLTGVAKRLRIAEEEFTRDDLPPVPLPGEKTFDWNDLKIVDPNDPMEQVIADAQHAATNNRDNHEIPELSGNEMFSSSSGEKEPAWWRPEEGKCLLSTHDIMTLDLYPAQTALLLEGASLYGGLPDIIEQHKKDSGQQRFTHQDPRIASCVANMLKIAVKYESLTAIDGSFPQKSPAEAITMLRECEDEFDSRALHAFIEMMNERPENYRNGTDLDYENPNEQLIEIFAADVPGPFDLKGWERYGQIQQQQADAEKAFVIQFAKDYLNHTAKQRERDN